MNSSPAPNQPITLVLGLGEIGAPLMEVLSETHECIGIDIEPREITRPVSVLHVCYPSQIDQFIEVTAEYAARFNPELIVIHSTVQVGTTRSIAERCKIPCAHSPIRGKHVRMAQDLKRYDKFIGGMDAHSTKLAKDHFESAGFRCRILSKPEATEFAKLTETTYFGLQIAWAQDIDRLCREIDVSYDEVQSIYEEIDYLPPVKFFPGVIGGHCVMPNIKIIQQRFDSVMANAIEEANTRHCESREKTEPKSSENSHALRLQNNVDCGQDVVIRDFTNLYGCKIGSETQIGPFVEIQKNAEVGRRCKISSHSFICEGVHIDDEVFIGHGVMFTNDRYPRATTEDGGLQGEDDWNVISTRVKNRASIGSGATILPGITIGTGSIVGAGSVVTKDVPDNCVVAGCPARVIRSNEPQTLEAEVGAL